MIKLRQTLVAVLSQGTWDKIRSDHATVGLGWHTDLEPGSGKPKYVERVLAELEDQAAVQLAERCLERLDRQNLETLRDAVWLAEETGGLVLSRFTREAVCIALDQQERSLGREPSTFLAEVLGEDANVPVLMYDALGKLLVQVFDLTDLFGPPKPAKNMRTSHLNVLKDLGLNEWPNRRLFLLLERLVHPEVRTGQEQSNWVDKLNQLLQSDDLQLLVDGSVARHPTYKVARRVPGVSGAVKNLVFAADGPKPEIGFADAVSNDIVILKNQEFCLVYDASVGRGGLLWKDLVTWWSRLRPESEDPRQDLGKRLLKTLGSEAEKRFFSSYFKLFSPRLGERLPALLPQVYVHWDPATAAELRRRGEDNRFAVQRMDFLMLLPDAVRVILEIDGVQHYSDGEEGDRRPSPRVYLGTVQGDRNLRLGGYEVYRFGGAELMDEGMTLECVEEFFVRLFRRHAIPQ